MTCKEARETLGGRLESSVSKEQWAAFEAHMTVCRECDRRLRQTESIRRMLRRCCNRLGAPQSLRSRIALALPHRAA